MPSTVTAWVSGLFDRIGWPLRRFGSMPSTLICPSCGHVGVSSRFLPPPAPGPARPCLSDLDDGQLQDRVSRDDGDIAERMDALAELILREDPGLPGYVVHELRRLDPSRHDAWRDQLILACEEIAFPKVEDDLWRLLCGHAFGLRDQAAAGSEPSLWAAIRRFASLAPEPELNILSEFLRPQDAPETRQVALIGVQIAFAAAPPQEPVLLRPLRERVAKLTWKYLDPDLMTPGQNASLLVNGLHALAITGDDRAVEIAHRVRRSGESWLIRLAGLALERSLSGWRSRDEAFEDGAQVVYVVRESLEQLSERVPAMAGAYA